MKENKIHDSRVDLSAQTPTTGSTAKIAMGDAPGAWDTYRALAKSLSEPEAETEAKIAESEAFAAKFIIPAAAKIRADIISDCAKHGIEGEKVLASIRFLIQ